MLFWLVTDERGVHPEGVPWRPTGVPVMLTLAILAVQLFYFGDFTPQIPLACGIAITALVGLALGSTWQDVEDGIFHVINVSFRSVSILGVFTLGYHAITRKGLKRIETFLHAANPNSVHLRDG